jgi:4-hydroxy-2-oxovalerate aldolase
MNENSRSICVLDCTLRDGSYPIDFQFTVDDTRTIVNGLESSGIEYIEVGHGLGLNAQNVGKGVAAATDREYLETAVETRSRSKIGSFYIPGIGTKSDLDVLKETDADFVRIGGNVTEWTEMQDHIEYASDLGLEVCGNLMKSYAVSPEVLGSRLHDLADWGADVGYIVDSAGGMLPGTVEKYVTTAVEQTKGIDIGLHCHNNLDLAVANSLIALESGATWIDATLGGIGRSAGNARLEVLTTVLQRRGYDLNIDQKHLMDLSQEIIGPM